MVRFEIFAPPMDVRLRTPPSIFPMRPPAASLFVLISVLVGNAYPSNLIVPLSNVLQISPMLPLFVEFPACALLSLYVTTFPIVRQAFVTSGAFFTVPSKLPFPDVNVIGIVPSLFVPSLSSKYVSANIGLVSSPSHSTERLLSIVACEEIPRNRVVFVFIAGVCPVIVPLKGDSVLPNPR